MPKTKFQGFIFTAFMVITMVYCMTLYNIAMDQGLSSSSFLLAARGMWQEAAAAFVLQTFAAGPMVRKLVPRLFQPETDRPILILLATAGCTVALMAPMMTLFVTLLHHGLNHRVILLWLPKLVLNFPFALCIQIFYVGPLVRLIFRTVFRKQLQQVPAAATVCDPT